MSHPDPCYDPDNSYEDDVNYDDHNDFFDDIVGQPEPIESCDGEIVEDGDYDEDECEGEIVEDGDYDEDECERSDFDESMDGDFESGMASAGWGTDEDYE